MPTPSLPWNAVKALFEATAERAPAQREALLLASEAESFLISDTGIFPASAWEDCGDALPD